MTLCIAATCTHQKQPIVILCSDWRAESGDLAGGDVEDKLSWIKGPTWAVLKAGIIPEADKLIAVYQTMLSAMGALPNSETLLPTLNAAFQQYRQLLINEYLSLTLGISYPALLGGVELPGASTTDKILFPEAFVEKTLLDIEQIPFPNCQLILAGFVEGLPFIVSANEDPADGMSYSRLRIQSNFYAIGSGASAAMMTLYRREHKGAETCLMQAIYHVYEAKLLGEVSPGVGETTSITVVFPSGECLDLSTKGHRYMEECFEHFGPLKITKGLKRTISPKPDFRFSSEYFEEYKPAWGKSLISKGTTVPQDPRHDRPTQPPSPE
ncbi:MAG: hypothetical protein AAB403_01385 [Planctomycetota bacterium]